MGRRYTDLSKVERTRQAQSKVLQEIKDPITRERVREGFAERRKAQRRVAGPRSKPSLKHSVWEEMHKKKVRIRKSSVSSHSRNVKANKGFMQAASKAGKLGKLAKAVGTGLGRASGYASAAMLVYGGYKVTRPTKSEVKAKAADRRMQEKMRNKAKGN